MAFYDEKDEDEDQVASGPVSLSAESGVVGSGQNTAENEAQGSTATVPKQSFVGISDYINANKPQSEKLAGQVTGAINQKAQAVDTELGNTQSSFNKLADSQVVQSDDNLLNQVKTDATGVVGDTAKKSSFDKLKNASYSGPQKLEDVDSGQAWANLQSKLKTARAAKDSVNTEEGRRGLIKEVANNPRQSQGALTFDNLLLQSNPNSAAILQGAGNSLADAEDRFAAANTAAGQKAADVKAKNEAVAANAKGAVSSGYKNLREQLLAREAAADEKQKADVEQLRASLASGNVSGDLLQQLGLSGGMQTFDVNPGDYLNYVDQTDINSVAGQEDLAREKALRDLAAGGVDLGEGILNSTAPLGQPGRGYNFNAGDLSSKINERRAEYQSKLNPILSQIEEKKAYINSLDAALGSMNDPSLNSVARAKKKADLKSSAVGWNENKSRAQQEIDSLNQQINALNQQYKVNQRLGA